MPLFPSHSQFSILLHFPKIHLVEGKNDLFKKKKKDQFIQALVILS